uniref:Thioredoxin domain-containing protein n=1 Tax=Oryza punctata TaxID=4537 RepID=A0A0E0L087_ORYPU
MDPDAVKSTLSNLAFGNVMAAAARDYQKEIVAKEKAQAASASHDEVDLDELLDDPELEKLHAERIAALKKEVEKREVLKRQGHGEYREITEGDFLGENAPFFVTKLGIKTLPCVILFKKGIATDRLIGFQDLGSKDDFSTRALENILKMKGISITSPYTITSKIEIVTNMITYNKIGIIDEKKKDEDDEDDETDMSMNRRVRSSTAQDSDSD